MTIVYFMIALGLLILVHEFGHFLVAKRAGVCVEKFSLGFGPRLVGFRKGETLYQISLLPLGGYVKMLGEDPESKEASDERAFTSQSRGRRFGIVSAGPLMNLLLALVLMPVVFMLGKPEAPYLNEPPVVSRVLPDSPASRIGLEKGDRIVTLDGTKIRTWNDLVKTVMINPARNVDIAWERKGKIFDKKVVLDANKKGESGFLGVEHHFSSDEAMKLVYRKYPFFDAIKEGALENLRLAGLTFDVVGRLVTLQLSYKALGGPIRIAQVSAMAAKSGLAEFFYFIAFLSLQLGILNLLPIPILDGGHLMFLGIETAVRRRINPKVQAIAQHVGLFLLLFLMFIVTANDINSIWNVGEIVEKIKGLW